MLVRMTHLGAPSLQARFVKETGPAAEIAELAEPVLESLGFRLVLVRIAGGQGPIVEILAERPDGTMSIEDCKSVSLNLSPLLDVHDPMPGKSYRLQISSPGIDRPLVRPTDFDQWSGYEAKIEMKELIDGRRRFRGVLEGFENGEVRIEVELGEAGLQVLGLPLGLVGEARLVLTNELVRESLRRAKQARNAHPPGSSDAAMDGAELDPSDLTNLGDDAVAPATSRNQSGAQTGAQPGAKTGAKSRSQPANKKQKSKTGRGEKLRKPKISNSDT